MARADDPPSPLPDPKPILYSLPRDRAEPLSREWVRRNMRSRRWWLGCLLLVGLPPAAFFAGARFLPTGPAAHFARTVRLGGATLGGAAAGLLAMQTLAAPVAMRNLRDVLANHAVCLRCGYDLRATPDRCPECGQSK